MVCHTPHKSIRDAPHQPTRLYKANKEIQDAVRSDRKQNQEILYYLRVQVQEVLAI